MRGVYCMSSTGNPEYGGGWNNQQLRKDCGLVPWLLAKNHGFRAVMVGNRCRYARAKIFCLTSRFESTPNVAAEALWAGCYLITSSIEAAQDITDRETCGKIFPKGDVERLGRLLLTSCRNDTKLRSGGEHAKEYARANYNMAAEVAKLNRLLYGG